MYERYMSISQEFSTLYADAQRIVNRCLSLNARLPASVDNGNGHQDDFLANNRGRESTPEPAGVCGRVFSATNKSSTC